MFNFKPNFELEGHSPPFIGFIGRKCYLIGMTFLGSFFIALLAGVGWTVGN